MGHTAPGATILEGLVVVGCTQYAKKPVTIDGVYYSRTDGRALTHPGNSYWQGKLTGRITLSLGKFNTREEANQKVTEWVNENFPHD